MLTATENNGTTEVLPGLRASVRPSKPAGKASAGGSASDRMAVLVEALADIAGAGGLDDLRAEIAALGGRVDVLEQAPAAVVRYAIGNGEPGPEVKGARPELGQMVRRVAAGLTNLYLCGPAGSGKTTLAESLATALKRPYGAQSFAADVTSSALVGAVDASGTFRESAFVAAYESGAVYLLDEVDSADSSILLSINAALANGKLFLPRHHDPARRVIVRHPETVIVCAANTWGSGPTAEYVGRAPLDAAFVDRFAGAQVMVDYDRELERTLCEDSALLARLWKAREALVSHKIRRILGTRAVVAAGRMRQAGWDRGEVLDALCASWSAQDRERCGVKAW